MNKLERGTRVIVVSESRDLIKYSGRPAIIINHYPKKALYNLYRVRFDNGDTKYVLPEELREV